MTDTDETAEDIRASINLNLPLATVSASEPWGDDVLDRSQLAATLTNLIKTQTNPFTISIDGHWGTGKTFLLQRWQQELENNGTQSIYFNAWEDDFCDDPLLAILGQLSEYFEDSRLNQLGNVAISVAIALLRQSAQTVLRTTTGLSLEIPQNASPTLLAQYLQQRKAKDRLKEHLSRLADAVHEETKHPLVFIIDELDRCRPTFAIELLEKVKHIFDIKHMVFVFGVNRSELSTSLRSVYGEIDSDVYLRRFFDIGFSLPQVDGSVYCKHVMDKYELQSFFSSLSSEANNRVHADEYRSLYDICPRIWSRFGMSLRDIDHCVALIALVARNVRAGRNFFPAIICLLIPIRLKNRVLYNGFVRQERLASEIIDYTDNVLSSLPLSSGETRVLDWIEGQLYFAESASFDELQRPESAISQLRLLSQNEEVTNPEYLSKRIRSSSPDRILGVLAVIESADSHYWGARGIIRYVTSLIDFYQGALRT